MSIVAPNRTLDQRLRALERANEVRSLRAALKRDMALRPRPHARRDVVDLLLDPPAEIATMKLVDVLLMLPKYGRVKVNKIISRCKVSPSKTIGGLSERQRREVARALEGRS